MTNVNPVPTGVPEPASTFSSSRPNASVGSNPQKTWVGTTPMRSAERHEPTNQCREERQEEDRADGSPFVEGAQKFVVHRAVGVDGVGREGGGVEGQHRRAALLVPDPKTSSRSGRD